MLEMANLHKTFNIGTENELKLFENFNLTINYGKLTAILGGNGSGKTTLLKLISGQEQADFGTIKLENQEITGLREEQISPLISKVYQDPSMGVSPSLTILENLALANNKNKPFTLSKLLKNLDEEKLINKLKELDLGLENKLNTKVKFLSGGQRQALSLTLATLKKPKLLLLDEHTAALDPKTSKQIMEKTKQLINTHNLTTLMISHNLQDALNYADRLIMINQGKLVLDTTPDQITEKQLIQIYTSGTLIA